MRGLSEFTIPYLGLSNGPHQYDFELDSSFFETFEKSRVGNGYFKISVAFDKQDRTVVLSINGQGYLRTACDRCLANIEVPVSFVDQVVLKIEERPGMQKDEVYYLDPGTSHIDLSSYLNEAVLLHLPINNIRNCQEEGQIYCDQEVLSNLGTTDKNIKVSSGENPWDELRKLNLE